MRIAFDIKLMRPACVLVAAGMGADSNLASRFETKDWLLAPTPDMGVYEINEIQLDQLVKKVEAHRRKEP
ncbi:hypothetical protein [Bradyrhizobium phage BDU-MI-1]|nr:hypothetical protein [Bradyrhizobium phage BDU-MI-1]